MYIDASADRLNLHCTDYIGGWRTLAHGITMNSMKLSIYYANLYYVIIIVSRQVTRGLRPNRLQHVHRIIIIGSDIKGNCTEVVKYHTACNGTSVLNKPLPPTSLTYITSLSLGYKSVVELGCLFVFIQLSIQPVGGACI